MLLAVILVGLTVFADAAPRSKSKGPQLVYDQKQHGDYNIQVHLKDFQVIALLGEDTLGGLGDYDYNYDYTDFTVKPSSSSSPSKPTQGISTTSTKPELFSTTTKPSIKPNAEINTEKVDAILSTTGKPLGLLSEEKPAEIKPSSETPIKKVEEADVSTEKTVETTKKVSDSIAADSIPGQIQVQVINSAEGYPTIEGDKVKSEERVSTGKSNNKKCLTGFSRDKRGRCRRVRKPQNILPFNLGRLANLAKRFRANDNDDSKNVTSPAHQHPHKL